MNEDPLAPARGCVWGVVLGCATWGAILLLILTITSFFGFGWSTH